MQCAVQSPLPRTRVVSRVPTVVSAQAQPAEPLWKESQGARRARYRAPERLHARPDGAPQSRRWCRSRRRAAEAQAEGQEQQPNAPDERRSQGSASSSARTATWSPTPTWSATPTHPVRLIDGRGSRGRWSAGRARGPGPGQDRRQGVAGAELAIPTAPGRRVRCWRSGIPSASSRPCRSASVTQGCPDSSRLAGLRVHPDGRRGEPGNSAGRSSTWRASGGASQHGGGSTAHRLCHSGEPGEGATAPARREGQVDGDGSASASPRCRTRRGRQVGLKEAKAC